MSHQGANVGGYILLTVVLPLVAGLALAVWMTRGWARSVVLLGLATLLAAFAVYLAVGLVSGPPAGYGPVLAVATLLAASLSGGLIYAGLGHRRRDQSDR
jgi:peptidoglycan/LPS O-acetylase OafA/YrhL